jgi:murein DD-endopeptidase
MQPLVLALLVGMLAAGCSWGGVLPDEPEADASWRSWGGVGPGYMAPEASHGERPAAIAVGHAHGLIGAPYRWGGATPTGFDCSGLVYYTFRKAGVDVPRTSQQQFRAATPVPRHQVEPGDLVFFGHGGRVSHVGIYAGDGHFIHAPVSGRPVTLESLDESYYRRRFAGAGRLDQ